MSKGVKIEEGSGSPGAASPSAESPSDQGGLEAAGNREGPRRKGFRKGSSFADSLAYRDDRSLTEMYRIDSDLNIPEKVIEWTLKCFGYFDASSNGWSKDIIRDPLIGDMDPWELREALFLGGRHEVTDDMVVEMIKSAGKVEHADVRINFREFTVMCWKFFFVEPEEDGDASDVRDAFEILGGGPGTEGQVSVDKLKSFASSAQLTIDVDKFVGEVDEDGSGLVDYDEFCKLFADSKIDTNLHDTGQVWLRNDKDEVLGKDPAGGGRNINQTKRRISPTDIIVNEDSNMLDPEATGRPDSTYLDGRAHEQTVSITRHREGFFDDTSPFPGSAVLHAPKMKKVLQNTMPKFERTVFANSVDTKCRRGWRCSQMNRNNPRNEGYNYYNVKPTQFQELDLAGVKMRKRGAEYTIKEHSNQRINVRLSTEMRCMRQTKILSSRPQSRAATAMGGSLYGSQMASMDLSHANSRPQTVPVEGYNGKRRNLSALSVNTGTDGDIRRIAEGLLGSRGLMSSWGGSVMGTTRNYSYKDTSRRKAWQTNMKSQTETLPTADLLKLASSAGIYDGRGYSKDVGPGHSFFDGGSP